MKRFSLSRAERITKAADVRGALRNGAIYRASALNLGVAKNEHGVSRIAVSLPRSKFKFASQRNRLRRCFKEIFRLNKRSLKDGYDIIVMPHQNCADRGFSELKDEFLRVAKKAEILAVTQAQI